MAKQFLNISEPADRKARIEIDGTIGFDWDTWEPKNTGADIRRQLDELSALDVDEIEVLITSLGGFVDDALQIHDALKEHKAKVTTIVQGFCASGATIIACAGDERIISPNALYLIHKCMSSLCDANENTLESELEEQRAKSLAFSPDDRYVIIGTERGYIYRWVLDGSVFVPEDEREDENRLQNALLLGVGYGRLNTNYYMGSISFDVGYRNYFRPPFFWGLNGSLGVGLPGSEFPYTYYEGGESLSAPNVYTLAGGAAIGLVYYNKAYDFSVFSEAGLGTNMRMLYNNSLSYRHTSRLYTGGYGEMLVGLQWKWFRASGGVQYDTNLHWLSKFSVGVAIPTKSFKGKK